MWLDKSLKLTKASQELGVVGEYIPVVGYYRYNTPKFQPNGQYWMDGGWLTTLTSLAEAMGVENDMAAIYARLEDIDAAKIQNRTTAETPTGRTAYIEFAIYDHDGTEEKDVSGEIYRPCMTVANFQGGNQWTYGYVAETVGGLANDTGYHAAGSSGTMGWILLRADPNVTQAVNRFVALACKNSTTDPDDDTIDGYIIYNISKNVKDGVTQYWASYWTLNAVAYTNNQAYHINPIDEDTSPQADPDFSDTTSAPGGYGGTGAHDHTSDKVGVPAMPQIGITQAGFIRVYNPTQAQLQSLGNVLFPPSPTQASDVVEALLAVAAGLYNSKLIDSVIDCHVIPVAPTVGGSEEIYCGNVGTGVSAARVTSDYVDFDCGSIAIPEQYGNYIDFTNTRARLFLPFVGFVDLAPEYWQQSAVTVTYRFNVVDGSFMAFIICGSSKSALEYTVVGQYGGNACLHFPVTGQSYAAMLSGLITGSMSLAASAASGNVVGALISAQTMAQSKPTTASSNNYNCSTAFLGGRRPYMLIERPVPAFAAYYPQEHGIPSNITYQLSKLSGYAELDPNIDLSGITAPVEVIDEIRDALASGSFF